VFSEADEKLLSAQIVGAEAATLIHILMAFIKMGASLKDIASMVYIHPALAEVISVAASNAQKKRI